MKSIAKVAAFLTTVILSCGNNISYAENPKSECIVLLHGLTRSSSAMQKMEVALQTKGYQVVNVDYPSTKNTVEVLSKNAIAPAVEACDNKQIHFVTHSMGGILVRHYLTEHTPPNLGKVVMMGPPNQGSEVIDTLGKWPGFHWINGDAGLQLGTDSNSLPLKLGPANFELGVIAGNRTINFILSAIIPGPDDGKVSVKRTKLQGMRDHIVLPVTHPFMMKNDEVIRQTLYFLNHGAFDKTAEK